MMMSEQYATPSGVIMKTAATPLAAPDDDLRKKARRNRLPPVPYNENDSVMQDIRERMRERRRRIADLNRSQRGNISNASIMLKLSLRANNRALAKALEEGRCEAAKDKETIQQLQWSFGVAQQELRQTKQRISDLESEGSVLVDMVSQLQISEDKMRQTVSKIRKVLKDVTEQHLLTIVTQIDDAVLMCNHTRSLSKGSSFFVRSLSDKSDDSRDTFSAPVFDASEPQRMNIYNKSTIGQQQRSVGDVPEDEPEVQPDDRAAVSDNNMKKDFTPNRHSSSQASKRPSSTRKKPRMSSLLDPAELEHALTSEANNDPSLITEESEDILSRLSLEKTDYDEREMELTHPKNGHAEPTEAGDHRASDDGEQPRTVEVYGVPGEAERKDATKGSNDAEKGLYSRKDVEDENAAGGEDGVNAKLKKKKTSRAEQKKQTSKKLLAKGEKGLKKPSKKLALKKSLQKKHDKVSTETSVFDLSSGESFSKSSSPFVSNSESKFVQNLSTESERSEPGTVSQHSMDGMPDTQQRESGEAMESLPSDAQNHAMDVDDRPLDVQLPQTRRKSRHSSHSKIFKRLTSVLTCETVPDVTAQEDVTDPSHPYDREARTFKEIGQILNESSFVAEVDIEGGSVLARKPAFHRKVAGMKKKKRLYDPKKSLDTEVTHASITSSDKDIASAVTGSREKESLLKATQAGPKREVGSGIDGETLNGLLDESLMKDFLSEIDTEKGYNEVTRKPSVDNKDAHGAKKKKSRKVTSKKPVTDDLPKHDLEDHIEEKRPIRRGTVCLTMKGIPEPTEILDSSHVLAAKDIGCGSVGEVLREKQSIRRTTVCLEKGRGENMNSTDAVDFDQQSANKLDVERELPMTDSHARRGTVCLGKKRVSESAIIAPNECEGVCSDDVIESDDGIGDKDFNPSHDADDRVKDKQSIRRGNTRVKKDSGRVKKTSAKNKEPSGDADCAVERTSLNDEDQIRDMQADRPTEGKREIRRGTVCLDRKPVLDERSNEADEKPVNGGQRSRRGTFAIKPNRSDTGEDGSENEGVEERPDKGMPVVVVTKKPAREKKASTKRGKRKSEELDDDSPSGSNKRVRRKEVKGELDSSCEDSNDEDQSKMTVKPNGDRPSSLVRSKFGWGNKERGKGKNPKTDKYIVEDGEEHKLKESAPAPKKQVGKSSKGRSSSLARRGDRNVGRSGKQKLREDTGMEDLNEVKGVAEQLDQIKDELEEPAPASKKIVGRSSRGRSTSLTRRGDGNARKGGSQRRQEDDTEMADIKRVREGEEQVETNDDEEEYEFEEPAPATKKPVGQSSRGRSSSSARRGGRNARKGSSQKLQVGDLEMEDIKKGKEEEGEEQVNNIDDEEEYEFEEPAPAPKKLAGQSSRGRSSSSTRRGGKNVRKGGSQRLQDDDTEVGDVKNGKGEDGEEQVNKIDAEVCEVPTRRKSVRVSERVFMERGLLKKTVVTETDDELDEDLIKDDSNEGVDDEFSNEPSSAETDASPEINDYSQKEELPQKVKKMAKSREGVKTGKRKSRKKEVVLLSESEDEELDDDDLSRYSAKLISRVEKSNKENKGIGMKNANCVRFEDEGQECKGDNHDDDTAEQVEQGKAPKVEDNASRSKKRKVGKKSQEREMADKARQSKKSSSSGDAAGSRISRDCSGQENQRVVDGRGDVGAPVVIPLIDEEEEVVAEEETQRRPSRQARVKAVMNLKEPSLSKKLRRGDPFTDAKSYVSPTLTKGKKGKASKKKDKARTALGDATNVT